MRIRTKLLFLFSYIKNTKTSSKRTFDYADYDDNIWVIYYSNIKEVVLFGKISKESVLFKKRIK